MTALYDRPIAIYPGRLPVSIDWSALCTEHKHIECEIGFGRPHYLIDRAFEIQSRGLIVGLEWKREWVLQAQRYAQRHQLNNLFAIHGNAWHLFASCFRSNELDMLHINFPDPWWKSKHRKRRVVNDTFVDLIVDRLKVGGQIFIQSDVASLLEEALEAFESHVGLSNIYGAKRLCEKKPLASRTHREKKCAQDGVPIFRAHLQRSDKN